MVDHSCSKIASLVVCMVEYQSINKSRFRYILGSDLPRAFSCLVCFALVEDPNCEYLILEKMRVVDTLTVHPSTSARLNSNASIIMTMLYGESRTPAGSTPPMN